MSVKILLYTLLKQIGIFLVVSFLVFRGTFVESDSLGLNLSTGVSLLLSVILWGIINLHTYWLIPGYLFQRRYKKYIIYLSCLVGFMLTAMVGAICFLGQYYVIPEQMQRLNSDLPFFLLINALALILYFLAFSFTIFLHRWVAYQQRLNELENISIQTDLNHLKDQLQPEFFSRILNKVRTLLGEDGEKASLLIFKLSRLLRYQLYESERQQVLLGDDIDFMTDYMKLEKLCNPEFNFEVNILGVNLVSVLLGFIFLSPLYQRYGIRGFCIQDNHAVSFDSIAYGVLVLLLSVGGCTSFELFRRWVVSDKKILELEKATKQTELQQLKKQINPHFLFNMLNNANILVKDAPDEASQILEKLDNLLRYQLNDSTRREVFLTADIQFLTSFLELEKVRRDHFEYTIFQEGNMENICIPPLLFIPFVENAVKHNLDSDNLSYVHLYFSVHNKQLTFRCENSKPRVPVKREGGIGLANVKRRLDLLYESRYTLQIEDKETTYNVNLHLNL